jgi:hypothetical protein
LVCTFLAISFGAGTALAACPSGPSLTEGNLTFDLSCVRDSTSRIQILAALKLGFSAANRGGQHVGQEIRNLRANGAPRTIRFYSDIRDMNDGQANIGARAFTNWQSAEGEDAINSVPALRSDIQVFFMPGQPYWDMVNNVWHELLHVTLTVTHSQTSVEGTIAARFVNDPVWYSTIKNIMLDFPQSSPDPVTGQPTELYNLENSPWS